MITLNIYEAHYLTWTAGPNIITKGENSISRSYFYDSLSGPCQITAQETFSKDVVCIDVLSSRRFLCAPLIRYYSSSKYIR
jgi:hypothetical protein